MAVGVSRHSENESPSTIIRFKIGSFAFFYISLVPTHSKLAHMKLAGMRTTHFKTTPNQPDDPGAVLLSPRPSRPPP